jgi:hypothetical protein
VYIYICLYIHIYIDIYAFIFKDANPKPISFLWKHLPFKPSLGPAHFPFWLSSSKPRKAWSTMRRVSNWLHLKPGAHGWIHWDLRRNLKQHSYSILKITGKIQPNYYHLSTYYSTIYLLYKVISNQLVTITGTSDLWWVNILGPTLWDILFDIYVAFVAKFKQ